MSEPKRESHSGAPPPPRAAASPSLSAFGPPVPGPNAASASPALSAFHAPAASAAPSHGLAPRVDAVGPAAAPAIPVVPVARVPRTIDGRPAVHIDGDVTKEGRRVFRPLRDPAAPAAGVSPYPHYSAAVDGGPGHLSDLSVHTPPEEGSTIARLRQTYVAPLPGGHAPPDRTDRYVDTGSGLIQRKAKGAFTPEDTPPLSPRTTSNRAPRTNITFDPL